MKADEKVDYERRAEKYPGLWIKEVSRWGRVNSEWVYRLGGIWCWNKCGAAKCSKGELTSV